MPNNRYETMFLWLAGGMLFLFAIALSISVAGLGIEMPSGSGELAYEDIASASGLHEIASGRYEVYLTASANEDGFRFEPSEIDIPVDSEVTFFIASEDVVHGFKVADTNISVMVIPGQIAEVSYIF